MTIDMTIYINCLCLDISYNMLNFHERATYVFARPSVLAVRARVVI